MSTSAIGGLSSSYLQEVLANALQSAGISQSNATSSASDAQSYPSDSSQLSPFARLASALQQLQQSNPTEYKQVTAQIATNLLSASQTAQTEGNSSAASQLSQLATDFTDASQTGQLPNLQDLAQAVGGGGGHRHHHPQAASSDSSGASVSSGSSSSGNTASLLSQFLASLVQTNGNPSSQDTATDPTAIILQTLANAGVNVSHSS
jgi:hypothetical protein